MKKSIKHHHLATGSSMTAKWETPDDRREDGACHLAEQQENNVFIPLPNPEVPEKTTRRKFTAAYKLRILQEAEQCVQPGESGALLRREGLYSSNLTTWRRQRENGILQGLDPRKRGRKAKPADPSADQIALLEKENQRLKQQLRKAEIIIEAQKKISEILGIEQNLENIGNSK
jgi:transposase-like protein